MNLKPRVAILLELVAFVISSEDFSKFRSTRVSVNRCFRSFAFSVHVVKRKIMCATQCSRIATCRRYMICSQPTGVECSLYLEGENCAVFVSAGTCRCFLKTYSQLNDTTICPLGLYGNNCENTITDCNDGFLRGMGGLSQWVRFYIKPKSTPFEALCRFHFGGFTVIMSRDRGCKEFSFNRNITEYIDGFGNADSDHWMGLTRVKEILENHPRNRLLVVLVKSSYHENYYDNFSIGTPEVGYPIYLGQFESWSALECGDSLKGIEGSRFSAPGTDYTSFNCADNRQGGWWYADNPSCSESSLTSSRDAMIWPTTLGYTPQSFVYLFTTPSI